VPQTLRPIFWQLLVCVFRLALNPLLLGTGDISTKCAPHTISYVSDFTYSWRTNTKYQLLCFPSSFHLPENLRMGAWVVHIIPFIGLRCLEVSIRFGKR